jgi:type II secretory ATPase GspE/PulE/Tfp pilus assembly ATPase PilB-like protein
VEKQITFAEGLRSIVRQDPDVILVGEIRDHETADIATNAALTGHLLFSTFHANDAATAIPRLLDMGVEPFLVASTVDLVIAQRLVRKICESCRYSQSVSQKELLKTYPQLKPYFSAATITLYKGKGCKNCGNTGYKGRIAIFEMIEITTQMQELITQTPSTTDIWKLAQKEGSSSLFEDGISKVTKGITTIDEVLRVANLPRN